MIDLRVLGDIRVRNENGVEVDALLRQPKRLALLAYLASPAPGTWHRRDLVLALFWPELDTAHARTSLRNSLYVLRQNLGDDVIRNRGDEEISVDPAFLRTDLSIVWDALKAGRIEEALAAYGGDLLPGLFPPDSEGFQRWLDTERTRLKVSVSSAAMTRIDELEREGKASHALTLARKVSEINSDDETVVRRVMTLHEAIGDRAGGLAAFESYRSRLATDFDADPAAETIDIADRLRSSTARPATRRIEQPVRSTATSEPGLVSIELPRPRHKPIILAAIAIVAVIAGTTAWMVSRPPRPASIGRSSPLTAEQGLQVEVSLSPNGRLVAYAKGNPNRLRVYVQEIGSGAFQPLTGDSVNIELMPRWSPASDEILYLSQNNAYVSPIIGRSARLVAKGTEGDGMVRSASWSPTGDSIAIVRNDSLIVQSQRGRGARFVGTGEQLHSCVWRPDAKWIACVSGNWIAFTPGPLFGNAAPSAIVLFPVAGGKAVNVTGSDFAHESPAWSSDGEFLWLLSDRDGDAGQAYAVRIGSDGHASGPFIRAGITAESISMSAGRLAYSAVSKKANIWKLEIPRDTALSILAARPITTDNQVVEVMSASRDGKWVMYDSNLHGNADIYRYSVMGDSSEQLTDDPRAEYAADLSPDGQEFAWQRFINGNRHLFVKRIDGDSAYEILKVSEDQGVPRWSPDGNSIAAWHHNKERGGVFVMKRDAQGKWRGPRWRLSYGQLPRWSPDGQTIAFTRLDGRVQSIPADSGEVKTIYAPRPGDPLATLVEWSRDPDKIWMVGESPKTWGIWELSVRTGRPRLVVNLDDPKKTIGPGFTATDSHFYFALNERTSNVRWAELNKR